MKIKYLLLFLTFYFTAYEVVSQDILDALKQTAEMYNEENDGQNTELTEEEQKQLEDFWKEKTKDGMDFINGLDKPHHQCLALIGLYGYQLITLYKAAEEEENCKMKYDYYGLTLLMRIGGTNLIPCAEEFADMSDSDLKDVQREFFSSLFSCSNGNTTNVWTPLAVKALKIANQILVGYSGPYYCDYLADEESTSYRSIETILAIYFRPESIVSDILEIGQKMESLGCGG